MFIDTTLLRGQSLQMLIFVYIHNTFERSESSDVDFWSFLCSQAHFLNLKDYLIKLIGFEASGGPELPGSFHEGFLNQINRI